MFNTGVLSLLGLTLTNGYAAGDGGAIFNNGILFLEGVTLSNSNTDTEHSGGAIVSYGPVTIWSSLLENNHAGSGGALYLRFSGASAEIANSTLRNNGTLHAINGWGGAILLWDGADAYLINSQLLDNTANVGGGIHNGFPNSYISTEGNSLIKGNSAVFHGGGIYSFGEIDITTTTISENTAGQNGGGIAYSDLTATFTNVTLSKNSAGISGGGIFNDGTAGLTNVTLSGNTAGVYGGGIYSYEASTTLINVTLSDNSAGLSGGGIYRQLGTVTMKNVILAHSGNGLNGANCYGSGNYLPGFVSAGFNLSSDTSCNLSQTGDQNGIDPRLGPLADNGGLMLTHILLHDSPAINAGTSSGAPATDQRGKPRPSGLIHDKGAIERQPNDLLWVYLPLLQK